MEKMEKVGSKTLHVVQKQTCPQFLSFFLDTNLRKVVHRLRVIPADIRVNGVITPKHSTDKVSVSSVQVAAVGICRKKI